MIKKISIPILLIIALIVSSCASSRSGYRPPKRKKKDCNCSKWSYNQPSNTYQLKVEDNMC